MTVRSLAIRDDDICFRLQNSLMNKNTTIFSLKVSALYENSKIGVMCECRRRYWWNSVVPEARLIPRIL